MFRRIKTILKANGNEVLNKLEEPKKMLRQSIRDMEEQKYKIAKRCIELNAKIKDIQKKITSDNEEILKPTLNNLIISEKKIREKYTEYDAIIEECKSKIIILETRAICVETTRDANNLLKEIGLDTSTFKRMEEKISHMESIVEAEQEFYGDK